MASHTGTIRGMAEASCRPPTLSLAGFSDTVIVFCSLDIDGIGFTAALTTRSSPFEIPASMPPELLLKKPPGTKGSLFSDPNSSAARKPAPISTPFTAPMDISPLARSASSLSKTGSPRPGGTPAAKTSTIPPTESPLDLTSAIRSSIFSAASRSGQKSLF